MNFDYLTGAPVKSGVSCAVGVVMGAIDGSLGQLAHRRIRRIIVSIPNSGFHHGLPGINLPSAMLESALTS